MLKVSSKSGQVAHVFLLDVNSFVCGIVFDGRNAGSYSRFVSDRLE